MVKNLFCEKSDLRNESDVEQFFAIKLLNYIGYNGSTIRTKTSLKELVIGRGSSSEKYKPDYVCYSEDNPKIVIDAKSPDEDLDDWGYQVAGYALGLNRKFKDENPVRFTILTNGLKLQLCNWDEEEPILIMKFDDFVKGNKKFDELIALINPANMKKQTGRNEISVQNFLTKPSVDEVKSAFNKCHRIIWKKDKLSPTDAFYEFSKIIFVKLNEDKRIRKIIEEGKTLKRADFKFSLDWLEERESETENPLSSILFADLLSHLQEQIEKNKKKPIFLEGEGIELKTPTIKEVVKVLQNYDLYTIDEDLNGRMFETFLNATIRGRELGQYFTPRKVVKFVTKMADLQIRKDGDGYRIDKVLDACCGSGGFLIDAMADLIEQVKARPALKPYKDEILEEIKLKSIFGIEANPKISRIARMNMYAHGDGGSRIYCADSLDKSISITKGTTKTMKKELEELKSIIDKEKIEFDVVISNPPFSMSYSSKEKDERKVLEQYSDEDEGKNLSNEKGTGKLKSSVKSNVLFVARYADLLRAGGRMFIILDNSVLNSDSHKEYRNFIRHNFLIKGVFQLPTHTFVNQEAGGITSILYLEKRKSGKQEQPPVFARMINNVGHSTSGKEEDFDDFNEILEEYGKYESTGQLFYKGKKINNFENDDLFLIPPEEIVDRFDVFFHQPSYRKLLKELETKEKQGKCELKKLTDYDIVEGMSEDEKDRLEESGDNPVYRYIDIGTIDRERGFIMPEDCQEGIKDELPERAKLYVKTNDVLLPTPFRSIPKVCIVPKELNNNWASSGFWGIRPKNYEEACLLWGILRSELVQKQLHHLSSGYTQRGLSNEYLKQYLIIPLPKNVSKSSKVIAENIEKAKSARKEELSAISAILKEAADAIA